MSYKGNTAPIPLGQLGLYTDEPQDKLPANSAIKANNISLYTSRVEKAGGSSRYPATQLPSSVVGTHDWWPSPSSQRLIAVTANGKIWRDAGDGTWSSNTALPSIESQKISYDFVPVLGSQTLTFNASTSTSFAYNATLAQVQTAVQSLTGLAAATVTGSFLAGYTVKMNGTIGDQTMLGTGTTSLKGNKTQLITFSGTPASGTWTLSYNGGTTTALAFNANAAAVQAALTAISGSTVVAVSGDYSAGFTVTLTNTATPLAITAASTLMTSAPAAITITVAPTYSIVITYTELAKGKITLGTLDPSVYFVDGGAETQSKNKKLFIYSGSSPIQVISGDSVTTADIASPASDWTTTYPTAGIIYQGRHIAFGNASDRHRLYISKLNDQEDFTTTAVDGTGASTFPIFSGEGDGIIGAKIYKGTLLLFKAPFGIYTFTWNGGDLSDPNNVSIDKFSNAFAAASSHSITEALDDLLGGANTGSVFSLKATSAFGAFEAADVLSIGRIRNYTREQFGPTGYPNMHSIYYPEKEIAYFTMRTPSSLTQNRILVLDMSRQTPRFTIETKDQPNCLALRRDSNKIQRPMYGSSDGYVYLMDQQTRNVAGLGFLGEFQTPDIDFSYLDQTLASKAKIFDFLQLTYQSQGNWNFYVDVFCDGQFVETLTFTQRQSSAVLGTFVLGVDKLGATSIQQLRLPLHCTGRAISFRIWNNGVNEYFKVERMTVNFRLSGEQARSSKG